MIKIKEDIQSYSSFSGRTIEDLYNEYGVELFSEDNIPFLKAAGLLDEKGYPIDEDGESFTLDGIRNLDHNFVDSPYIQELILKEIYTEEFNTEVGTLLNIKFDVDDLDYYEGNASRQSVSRSFLKKCFNGDVFEDFIDNYNISFSDCSYMLDDIPKESINYLVSKGFPENIFQLLLKGEEDEDSPLSDYYDDLKQAVEWAMNDAYAIGSSDACLDDFERAWDESMPDGVVCTEKNRDSQYRMLQVNPDWFRIYMDDIWEDISYGGVDKYAILALLRQRICNNLENHFAEPYYGWNECDDDVFRDCVVDRIGEIDFSKLDKQEEKSLFTFDNDTNEYEEDLEEDIKAHPYKLPKLKKLYYQYQNYNRELSNKAYQLDIERFYELFNWAKANDKELAQALDLEMKYDIDENGDYEDNIIISSIKPSYADSYPDNGGYTVWSILPFYDTKYLGAIPKSVGNDILKRGKLSEDIDIDPIEIVALPADFNAEELVYDGKYKEDVLDIIQYKGEENNFSAGYANLVDGFYDASDITGNVDFITAWEIFSKGKDYAWIWYMPDEDDLIQYPDLFREGEIMILCKTGPDNDEEDEE